MIKIINNMAVFLNCAEYTSDIFWKDIFQKCSNGLYPKGFNYSEKAHTIYVNVAISPTQNIKRSYKLGNDHHQNYDIIIECLRNDIKLRSEKDIDISKTELEKIRNMCIVDLSTTWAKLKPKSVKDAILLDYIKNRVTKDFGNDKEEIIKSETKKLYKLIPQLSHLKKLISSDFIYEDGELKDISHLIFDKQTKKYKSNRVVKKIYLSENKKKKEDKMIKVMDNWIKNIRKHR